jgi:hypothetical protein
MAGDIEKTQQIQNELRSAGVSRRGFIDRIKALGFGFGAAAALGVEGATAKTSDTSVNLSSTNPALDKIINDRSQAGQTEPGEKKVQEAWFRRWWYRRFFHRWYRRW